ncbi:MAG: nucleic acid-binding protein [Myxococcales bacterium]|nr:nucleic acid-binding protein [Myxococcales bacterium]
MILDHLGHHVTLSVRRVGSPGAFLSERAEEDRDVVLLPGREVPENAAEGDEIEVFIALDSEDRPIATREEPKLTLGEVTFLEVKAKTSFGAFVDWGLPKELLVPLGEQTRDVFIGERHPVGLILDDTGRLAGTMRVTEMLDELPDAQVGQWVQGEAWRNDLSLGLFVIVERRHVGLVPVSEPHRLERGAAAKFRITHVHRDGKIELSLRGPAHLELEGDAQRILAVLSGPTPPRVSDKSSPDELRELFDLSKKAFKRAAGRLLKEGAIAADGEGNFVVRPKRA